MEKIITRLLLSIIVLLLIISIFFQFKVENYKRQLMSEYKFYENKERIRHTPFVIFYFNSKVLNKHKIFWNSINDIYYKNKVFEEGIKESKVVYNIEYNAYLNYCFFKKEELMKNENKYK